MKRYLFFLFLILSHHSYSQENSLQWVGQVGSDLFDESNGLAIGSGGDIYSAGTFYGVGDFDPGPGTYNLDPGAGIGMYVLKTSASGDFDWAKQFEGDGGDFIWDISIDNQDNIYVIGVMRGMRDFDPGPGVFNMSTPNEAAFVVKLDLNGQFIWAKKFETTGIDLRPNGITVTASQDVLITGSFHDTTDFDPGPGIFNLTPLDGDDIFVVKLNPQGNLSWAKQFSGTSFGYGADIEVDGANNVYSIGGFRGQFDFDPGPGILNLTSNNQDAFISKLDSSGSLVWVKQITGPGDSDAFDMVLDNFNNIYFTGRYLDNVDFDPGPGTFFLTSQNSTRDIFLSKLDSFGEFSWAIGLEGDEWDQGNAITLNLQNNVIITGAFHSSNLEMNPGSGSSILSALGDYDIFVAKYASSSGQFMYAQSFGGVDNEVSREILVGNNNSVYVTGSFEGTVDFDPSSGTNFLTSFGDYDSYIAALEQDVLNIDDNSIEEIKIYPNPTSDKIFVEGIPNEINYSLFSVLGEKVDQGSILPGESINIGWLTSGFYLLRLEGGHTERIVIY